VKRRELFQAMAATAVGVNLMGREALDGAASPAPRKGASFTTRIRRLELRHTWTTTMSSSATRDTLHTQYNRDGITGYGEGAGIVRYQQSALGGQKALEALLPLIASADPYSYEKLLKDLDRRLRKMANATG